MSYWYKPPVAALRAALGAGDHISDEFLTALLEDAQFDDDKRERIEPINPEEFYA
jgi:hypothetical protein